MQHNTWGRNLEGTNLMALARGKVMHQLSSNSFVKAGGGAFFEDQQGEVLLDELYLSFRNSWLEAVVGKKQRPKLYHGLGASNGGFTVRSMPAPYLVWNCFRGSRYVVKKPLGLDDRAGAAESAFWRSVGFCVTYCFISHYVLKFNRNLSALVVGGFLFINPEYSK